MHISVKPSTKPGFVFVAIQTSGSGKTTPYQNRLFYSEVAIWICSLKDSIGCRCKHSNVFSRAVLINRNDLIHIKLTSDL